METGIENIIRYSVRGAVVFGLSSIVSFVSFLIPFFIIIPIGYILSGVIIGLFFPTSKKPARSKLFAAIGFGLGLIIPGIAVALSALAVWDVHIEIRHIALVLAFWGVGFSIAGVRPFVP